MQQNKDSKLKNDPSALTIGIRPGHLEINDKGNVQVIVQMLEQFRSNRLIHGVLDKTTIDSLINMLGYVISDIESVKADRFYQKNIHFCNSDTGVRIP